MVRSGRDITVIENEDGSIELREAKTIAKTA